MGKAFSGGLGLVRLGLPDPFLQFAPSLVFLKQECFVTSSPQPCPGLCDQMLKPL